jgi:hypothetical protein
MAFLIKKQSFKKLTVIIVSCHTLLRSWRGVLDTTLCDQVCQRLAAGWWFSPVSPTNKTDRHDITEILLKVAINTITLTHTSLAFHY